VFLINDVLHWSASDLTAAAECEFGVLRRLDQKLGWADDLVTQADPLLDHIARLGDEHEARLLEQLRAAGPVTELEQVDPPYTVAALERAGDLTHAALRGDAQVLYQAAFFDGEFFGYADFVERTREGWLVCDAKLARRAKPRALLQLGAYAEQLRLLEVPLSDRVALLLGSGERVTFPVAEILPVFRDHRSRLRDLFARHRDVGTPVAWGNDTVLACGACGECRAAAATSDDVLLVAGLRRDQRRKLRAARISTLHALAVADTADPPLPAESFAKLRAQAALQAQQMAAADGAPLAFELRDSATTVLGLLPEPSSGDLFFDFEGDPLHTDPAGQPTGLEYLWGFMDPHRNYTALWAHDAAQERTALEQFIDHVTARRVTHPDMHVYHYAPYETTALKRLAMRYQTREDELDALLRAEVFVDLFATVRGAVRVGSPSYSIKKLEPLYMGDQLRSGDDDAVGDGGASVVAYHQYVEMVAAGDDTAARRRLDALADYNEYDCLSTLQLRDWLLARAADAGVARTGIQSAVVDESVVAAEVGEQDPLFNSLLCAVGLGPGDRAEPGGAGLRTAGGIARLLPPRAQAGVVGPLRTPRQPRGQLARGSRRLRRGRRRGGVRLDASRRTGEKPPAVGSPDRRLDSREQRRAGGAGCVRRPGTTRCEGPGCGAPRCRRLRWPEGGRGRPPHRAPRRGSQAR